MEQETFKILTLEVPSELKESVSDLLLGLGAHSVSETPKDRNHHTISALFDKEVSTNNIAKSIELFYKYLMPSKKYSEPQIKSGFINKKEWESWKRNLKKIFVGKKIVIFPPWDRDTSQEKPIKIEITPSLAFGTGHHETTRLCIETIEDVVNKNIVTEMIDVGCGSGILGIVAAKLGTKHVIAFDNDPLAISETKKNIVVNRVEENFKLFCGTIESLSNIKVKLVVANISATTIIKLKEDLIKHVDTDGMLILSGITKAQTEQVLITFKDNQLRLEKINSLNDWVSLTFRKVR